MLGMGVVVVVAVGVSNFWGDIVVRFFPGDVERIQGRWEIGPFVLYRGPKPILVTTRRIEFEGKTSCLIDRDGNMHMFSYLLDEAHEPRWIDIGEFQGIYELNGDTLRICWGLDRPTTFEADSRGTILWVLQRE